MSEEYTNWINEVDIEQACLNSYFSDSFDDDRTFGALLPMATVCEKCKKIYEADDDYPLNEEGREGIDFCTTASGLCPKCLTSKSEQNKA